MYIMLIVISISMCMYICKYIYIYVCVCICVYIYIWSSVGQAPLPPRMGVQSCFLLFTPPCGLWWWGVWDVVDGWPILLLMGGQCDVCM